MRIAVPRDIKAWEYRFGLAPPSAAELIRDGHEVSIEAGAGRSDDDCFKIGTLIQPSVEHLRSDAELL